MHLFYPIDSLHYSDKKSDEFFGILLDQFIPPVTMCSQGRCIYCEYIFNQMIIIAMNAEKYPPINVLSVFKSVHSEKLPYKITPYRFMMKNGESFKISKIRHYHRDRKGKGEHFHYVVEVEKGRYFRLLFDTNTFTWRLIQEVEMGETVGFSEMSEK